MQTCPLTPTAVLASAAAILRQHGWCRRELQRSDGAHCLRGSILAVLGSTPAHGDLERRSIILLAAVLPAIAGEEAVRPCDQPFFRVVGWNDLECASIDEAVSALERAAGVVG